MAEIYADLGYDFVAITDHDYLIRPQYWESLPAQSGQLLVFKGLELEYAPPAYQHLGKIIGEKETLFVFNHPRQYGLSVAEVNRQIARISLDLPLHAIEVTEQGIYTPLYDTPEIPLRKVASDDAHSFDQCVDENLSTDTWNSTRHEGIVQPGERWTEVRMQAATTSGQGQRPGGRRRVLKAILVFSVVSTGAIVLTPLIGFLVPPKSSGSSAGGKVLAGTLDSIPLGQGEVVAMGSTPVMVVNTDQGVKAYEAICTHLGCIVAWDEGAGNIVCPCHDGRFNPGSGAVISGPPPTALPPVEVSVEGNKFYLVSG